MSEFVLDFDSSETGAPVLNNAAGSMIGVLDACLVTGFNNRSITSIVVAAGVATATCAGHGYSGSYSKDVELAGSVVTGGAPGALNGRKQLTFVDTNTFKFAAPGVADQAASGTITAKRASLGWQKLFAGTNTAIYKRSDITSTTIMLRVVDTNVAPASASSSRWTAIETASDIDTFAGLSPMAAQIPDGYFVSKGLNNSAPKQWSLVGSSLLFFFTPQYGSQILPSVNPDDFSSMMYCFGDFVSYKPGDAYNCILSGEVSAGGEGASHGPRPIGSSQVAINASGLSIACSRGFSQFSGAVSLGIYGAGGQRSGSSEQFVFPSPIDSGYLISPKTILTEGVPGGFAARGVLPGFVHVLGYRSIAYREVLSDVVDLPGRKLIGLFPYAAGPSRVAIDLTGPWA
jgi:hypothetical protein